ncbi:DUF547 domain-containing protein [Psychroflexus sp. ALD_RP9]|uniref:DUF547 domain-containing protein n=1 Tax=Psychroflexus sp. ALD_RP9 TaxID=2777186 RepID=UPI001A8F9039|nr:DUF547 domain-containing protein [Psychroflexus sp. ALD_RP9]QSS97800.1 DUF547 domain-containing protein [Psychroflexus sp. ALD_RP9]
MKSVLLISVFLVTLAIQSQDIHKHKPWNDLLQAFVNDDGLVNYAAFKSKEAELDQYLSRLNKQYQPTQFTEAQKKAYLINAYNAYTVKLILKHYPVKSIKAIGGFLESPFKLKFVKLGGKTYNLDQIEKEMLLEMGDARVHFAINCASFSCPALSNKAYIADQLNLQLELASRKFINSDKNSIKQNQLKLSKIFKWYSSDFEAYSGSVKQFIQNYYTGRISSDIDIEYMDYSWKLNKQ